MLIKAAIAAIVSLMQPIGQAAAPPAQTPEVTVTAARRGLLLRQVERVAQRDGKGRLARWADPVCPRTLGLTLGMNNFIDQRILSTAVRVGARPAVPGCSPNVIVLVALDADDFVSKLLTREKARIAAGRWDQSGQRLDDMATLHTPVRWFYVSDTAQDMAGAVNTIDNNTEAAALIGSGGDAMYSDGGAGPPSYAGVSPSRLTPSGDEAFSRILIVVNAREITGLKAGQVADYLSMIALAPIQTAEPDRALDSILTLFTAAEKPAGLTHWDIAYLSGLYRSNSQISYEMQISHVVDWMQEHDVHTGKGNAP